MQEAGWERRDETEGLFLAKSFPPCRLIIQEQSVCNYYVMLYKYVPDGTCMDEMGGGSSMIEMGRLTTMIGRTLA